MMFWSDHDMSGWGYTGMVIGMVLFWALIIVGIIALIRYTTGTTHPSPTATTRHRSRCWPAASPAGRSTKPNTANASRSCGPPRAIKRQASKAAWP